MSVGLRILGQWGIGEFQVFEIIRCLVEAKSGSTDEQTSNVAIASVLRTHLDQLNYELIVFDGLEIANLFFLNFEKNNYVHFE